MHIQMRKRFFPCRDCQVPIFFAKDPNGVTWPLQKVGESPNPHAPGQMLHDVIVHHDVCSNPRVEGNRDPRISHRRAKNEYELPLPEGQQQFRERVKIEGA